MYPLMLLGDLVYAVGAASSVRDVLGIAGA
jgi:hypothetical protein